MRAVLGIDAAWTAAQPSGVALAVEVPGGWQLRATASSYSAFCALSGNTRRSGLIGEASEALEAAEALVGSPVDLVAVDMPLSRKPIVARRASDDAVSRAYGHRWAATHTPSAIRPGPVSDKLRTSFELKGYELRTSGSVVSGLVEVYPHPALIEFASAERRLPYKFGNRRSYWPDETPKVRALNIQRQMSAIAALMENELRSVAAAMPELDFERASGREWKAYEDMLDAVVCAAVGICVLEGRAVPFGDDQSAIWIPKPGSAKTGMVRTTAGV
ncbi:DUF429 domain-containing protein [Mesorhizobium sp. B2-4-18]|uniref:DUF429 domain-containing protein n=1 Tax=Mesorhizobium sp. B2-4-18 TaxID=2589931 RepID=UPI0032B1F195